MLDFNSMQLWYNSFDNTMRSNKCCCLPSAKIIKISISVLSVFPFSNCEPVEFFDFGEQITKVPKPIPLDVGKIILTQSLIKNIDTNTFVRFKNLQYLDLNNNQIRHIFPAAFNGFGNESINSTNVISLTENHIENLRADMWGGIKILNILHLNDNKISSLKQRTFSTLEGARLKHLQLEKNCITSIENGAFHGLNFLEELHISVNLLQTIEPGVFFRFKFTESPWSQSRQHFIYEWDNIWGTFKAKISVSGFQQIEKVYFWTLKGCHID